MYGVREQDMPEDWETFCIWFDEMTRTRLERSDMTDRVFGVVTAPKPPPHIPVLRHAIVWNTTVRPVAGLSCPRSPQGSSHRNSANCSASTGAPAVASCSA